MVVGEVSANVGTLTESEAKDVSETPQINHYVVKGDVDPNATGVDFYKKIEITLIGENLTDKHFLTKEGLHWSDKTSVELIKGTEQGILNDVDSFGVQNTPTVPVKAFSNQIGDSGRITFVGKTKSNDELDLIWTVTGSDAEEWATYSGYHDDHRVKGLGFIGEQFIPGATGNSIAVLYNNASNLGIHYKIVKHGTMEEMPVILSFISTDIDAAQGVQTNLANIVEIIPKESNLIKKEGIIYDSTPGVVGLNGSVDLPKGGYLGAGFLSNFDYTFYSPAPERVYDSYYYPIAVRYDIFGSSLQANLLTRVQNNLTVSYVDEAGTQIKPNEHFTGFHDEKYFVNSVSIPKYRLINIKKDHSNSNYSKVEFVYRPVYTVTLKFVDEQGKSLSDSQVFSAEKGYQLSYLASTLKDYITPALFNTTVDKDIAYTFVYKKIPKVPNQTIKPKPDKVVKEPVKPHTKEPIKPVLTKDNQLITPIKPNTRKENEIIEFVNPEPKPDNKIVEPIRSNTTHYYPILTNREIIYHNTNQVIVSKPPVVRDLSRIKVPLKTIQFIVSKLKKPFIETLTMRDPFLVNTGMNAEEKKQFFTYLEALEKESRKKYGNNQNKINHGIANGLAYPVYHNNRLQNLTNDFGERPKALNKKLWDFFENLHDEDRYLIDFPHLGAPLATAEKSVWYKEVGKFIVGLSPLMWAGEFPNDVFFQMNSMTGDLMTHINDKDVRTNMDAYIFYYHPSFKNMTLDEKIKYYYHLPNLDVKRQQYYQEILEMRKGLNTSSDYAKFIQWGSAVSIAGAVLFTITFISKEWERFKKEPLKYVNERILKPIGEGAVELFTNSLRFFEQKIVHPVGKFFNNAWFGIKSIYNKRIDLYNKYPEVFNVPRYNKKPTSNVKIANYSVKPKYSGKTKVAKPTIKKVVLPVKKAIYTKIVQPVGRVIKRSVAKIKSHFVKRIRRR